MCGALRGGGSARGGGVTIAIETAAPPVPPTPTGAGVVVDAEPNKSKGFDADLIT